MAYKALHYLDPNYFATRTTSCNNSHISRSCWTKLLVAPGTPICCLLSLVLVCGPLHSLTSFLLAKFYFYFKITQFLYPFCRLGCCFLRASLSSCTYFHYNNYYFTLHLTFYLSHKFLEGRNHFLFISIYPVYAQSVGYHFAHTLCSFPPPLIPLFSFSAEGKFLFPPSTFG